MYLSPMNLGRTVVAIIISLTFASIADAQGPTTETLFAWPRGINGDPQGPLVEDGEDLVGVTGDGGTIDGGLAFKLRDGVITTFYEFTQSGSAPRGGLIRGNDGNYYGTTFAGGLGSTTGFPASGNGTVYRLTPAGQFTVLHNFSGANGNTANPFGELLEISPLVFVGVTQHLASTFGGAVFQVDASGQTPAYSVLKTFNAFADGRFRSGLIKASDGRLYGSTEQVIFGMDADGQNFTELRRVTSSTDTTGFGFATGVTEGADGLLYGTSSQGGTQGRGVVFRIAKSGMNYEVLHHFDGTTGGGTTSNILRARIIAHSDGNLYGTAPFGGNSDSGTLFRVTQAGVFSKLTDFAVSIPTGLVERDGNLLVTTAVPDSFANVNVTDDRGVLYQATTMGGLTILYAFNDTLGRSPVGAPLQASDGHWYGTTAEGGANGLGTLWRRRSTGEFEVLTSFGSQLSRPDSGLIEGSDGLLYGTVIGNYAAQTGNIYSATKAGAITRVANVANDGGLLGGLGGVVEGLDGALYAVVNAGRLVRVTKAGELTVLRTFSGADGTGGYGPPALDEDGAFYGVTRTGGANGVGTVWRYAANTFSVLRPFLVQESAGTATGTPRGPLVRGRDGTFYGLLFNGVTRQFRITTNGAFTLGNATSSQAVDGEPLAMPLVERTFGKFFAPHFLSATATDTPRSLFAYAISAPPAPVALPPSPVNTSTVPVTTIPRIGGIARGSDVNLYGVLPDGATDFGSLYRVVFPPVSDPLPEVVTLAPASVQSTTATLSGTVTPNGTPALVHFEFGATTAYGRRTPSILIEPGASATQTVSAAVSGLARGSEFHYRIVAENDKGRANGNDIMATTLETSAPIAVDDIVPIRARETLTISVLANDIEPDEDTLTIQSFTQGTKGTVTQVGDTLTYTPSRAFAGFDTFEYVIRDSTNATDTATVIVRNPFTFFMGSYTALLDSGDGMVTLTVSKGGAATAKIALPSGKTVTLKGSLGLDGRFVSTKNRPPDAPLVADLTLQSLDVPRMSGTIDGGIGEMFTINNVPITATVLPNGIVDGKYTAVFTPPDSAPEPLRGYGFSTVSLSKKAAITFAGQLPDGSKLLFAGKLRADGTCSIFTKATRPVRTLRADFNFTPTATAHFTGALQWTRAEITKGFYLPALDLTLDLAGSLFSKAPKNVRSLAFTNPTAVAATADLNLTGGNLPADLSRTVSVSQADRCTVTGAPPELLKIAINRSNGLFTGTFRHAGFTPTRVAKFRGVLRQTPAGGTGLNAGFGLFLGPTNGGRIEFEPQ